MNSDAPKEPVQSSTSTDASESKGIWNTVLTSLPIGLTILATIFAGMSSSEMTQAMYYRSLAAQHQSKAGDQWAFFQAKKMRETTLRMTAELLRNFAQRNSFDTNQLDSLLNQLTLALEKTASEKTTNESQRKEALDAITGIGKIREQLTKPLADKTSVSHLRGSSLPKSEVLVFGDARAQEDIEAALKAIRQRQTESETANLVRKLNSDSIEQATRIAEQNADNFDKANEPVAKTTQQLRDLFDRLTSSLRPFQKASSAKAEGPLAAPLTALDGLNKDFKLAVIEFDAQRYGREAFFNRKAGELYELRVRRSGVESDRHRERSKNFFYSMLLAQLGVTVASLALARRQRRSLWLFAAFAGLAAVCFSSYIYVAL